VRQIKRKKQAQYIASQYFGASAPFEVNIDGGNLNSVMNLINNSDQVPLEKELFENIEKVVDLNLFDIFNRFRFTSEYTNYLEAKRAEDIALEKVEQEENQAKSAPFVKK
jgi:hypothetical protein